MVSADTTADILPAQTIRVLDMQSPGLPLHARLLEVSRLELDLIKSVTLVRLCRVTAGVASPLALVPRCRSQ